MKIKVDKNLLLESISTVDSFIPTKSINNVLSSCLFNVSRDEIEILSTDNDIGVRTIVDAKVESEVSFIANGTRLCSILKELPEGVIEIDVSEDLLIKMETKTTDIKGQYNLIGSSGTDYPEIKKFYDKEVIEIKQDVLKDMIRKVIHAAATDTIKPSFNGIYIVSDSSDKITFVCSDSRRLSQISRDIDDEVCLERGVIIPLKTINGLYRLLKQDGVCKISFFENQCFFKINNTEIVSRVIDSEFPEYKNVIPKEQKVTAIIQKEKFMRSLRRAMIFTREPANKVTLNVKENILTIEARTNDLGEAKETVPIESNAVEDISVAMNVQFLIDSIREIDSSSISLCITGQKSPVTIRTDEDKEHITIIMPIKVKTLE